MKVFQWTTGLACFGLAAWTALDHDDALGDVWWKRALVIASMLGLGVLQVRSAIRAR